MELSLVMKKYVIQFKMQCALEIDEGKIMKDRLIC